MTIDEELVKEITRRILNRVRDDEIFNHKVLLLEKGWLCVRPNPKMFKSYLSLDLRKPQKDDVRYLALIALANEIKANRVKGAVAELGVYRGHFAKRIRKLFPTRKFYLFDTFSGFSGDQADHDTHEFQALTDDFSNTSVEMVLENIGEIENCIVKQGLFPDSTEGVQDTFAFVSLDVDLYQPTYDGLHFFYDRLAQGGFILVHDYRNKAYPGCGQAVREFCAERKVVCVPLPDNTTSAVITK